MWVHGFNRRLLQWAYPPEIADANSVPAIERVTLIKPVRVVVAIS